MSANDPKRTLSGPLTSLDQIDTMPCPEPRGEAMRRRDFITLIGGGAVVCTENLNPDVVVMKPAKDRV